MQPQTSKSQTAETALQLANTDVQQKQPMIVSNLADKESEHLFN